MKAKLILSLVGFPLALLATRVTVEAAPTLAALPTELIQRAVDAFTSATNVSAAVDLDTVDRLATSAAPTRAKESWKFSKAGGTNTFTRTRFVPVAGNEMIESTNYSGGRMLVGSSSVAMPAGTSLPGFEALNHLTDMLVADPVVEAREGASFVVSAKLRSSQTLKAWFSGGHSSPSRIEKYQGSALVFVLTRTDAGAADSVLPLRDALHFYENGRVTTTVLRSFSGIRELSERPHEDSAPPRQK